MTVSLKIENDVELRAHIKDIIRGQITSIIRNEITAIISEVTNDRIKGLGTNRLDRMISDGVKSAASAILWRESSPNEWKEEVLIPLIQTQLEKYIGERNIKEEVNKAAKAMINKLIQ